MDMIIKSSSFSVELFMSDVEKYGLFDPNCEYNTLYDVSFRLCVRWL